MRPLATVLVCLVLGSCYAPGTIRRVTFHVSVKGIDRDATAPFTSTTPGGWQVTLTTADVSLGPLYLRNSSSAGGTIDFSDYGRAVAEVLGTFTVDALDPTPHSVDTVAPDGTVVPAGDGTTEGAVASEVRFAEAQSGPISDDDPDGPGDAVAHVAGTAVAPDGHRVTFDGFLRLPLLSPTAGYAWTEEHRVTNIDSMLTVDQDGTLTLTADATHWMDSVSFDALGTTNVFDSASARGQWLTGIGSRDAYTFVWQPAR